MLKKHIHSRPLLIINRGVDMIKDLIEIHDIDNDNNVTKILYSVDDYVVNGTFIEWRHNG